MIILELIIILESSEVDSETERMLLESSDEEEQLPKGESPLTIEELIEEESTETFRYVDINTSRYWKEVRRLLFNRMGSKHLSPAHFHTFSDNFARKGGIDCRSPKPTFDAWCLVIGKCRREFDLSGFMEKYPSVENQLEGIRKYLNVIVKRKIT